MSPGTANLIILSRIPDCGSWLIPPELEADDPDAAVVGVRDADPPETVTVEVPLELHAMTLVAFTSFLITCELSVPDPQLKVRVTVPDCNAVNEIVPTVPVPVFESVGLSTRPAIYTRAEDMSFKTVGKKLPAVTLFAFSVEESYNTYASTEVIASDPAFTVTAT